MKIITRNPIIFDDYSNALGDKTKEFFSKTSREERQKGREAKQKTRKEDRIADRITRKTNRKTKYGARPLKSFIKGGKKFWEDKVPKVFKRKKANGTEEFVKQPTPTPENPNPAPIVVPKEQIIVVPPNPVVPGVTPPPPSTELIIVDKQDLDNENLVDVKVKTMPNGEQQVVQELPEEKAESIIDPLTNPEPI